MSASKQTHANSSPFAQVTPQMTVKVKGIDLPDYALTGQDTHWH